MTIELVISKMKTKPNTYNTSQAKRDKKAQRHTDASKSLKRQNICVHPRSSVVKKEKAQKRSWPDKHKQKLAKAAQKSKPWTQSTGPKTPAGKTRSSTNARKSGLRTSQIRRLRRLLRIQKAILKQVINRELYQQIRALE